MHQPRSPVIRVSESYDAYTVPCSRPPGRKILYARRSILLIFPLLCTFNISSEYSSTASVFSSCGGNGAFTHCGASLARAEAGPPAAQSTTVPARHTTQRATLIACGCGCRLQYDLLIIGRPHFLIKSAKCRVEFLFQNDQIAPDEPLDVQRPVVVFRLHRIQQQLGIVARRLRHAAHLPAERQLNLYVVHLLRSVMKIQGMHSRRVFTHVLFRCVEKPYRHDGAPPRSRHPAWHLQAEFSY